jgi:hypothetical protein
MTKPKAKTKKPAARKPKSNPTDPLALARSVVEAAIGEPLTPKKPRKKKPAIKKSSR